jgi:ABC-type antimicrobial peptide transport system permease subunit
MNIPLLQGRLIEESDVLPGAPRVAVVDQALAHQYWPDTNAIGRRFSTDAYSLYNRKLFGNLGSEFVAKSAYTIVGIVGNAKQTGLAETEELGAVYVPYTQSFQFQFVLRTSLPASVMQPTVEELVRQLDPNLPIDDFRSMQARIDESLVMRRSPAILAVAFAGVSLLLVSIGIYGALAYAVAQRKREIGVRMALGAMPEQIGRQFLSLGLRMLVGGTLLGCFGAWAAGRAMQSFLFQVPSFHMPSIVGTVCVIGVVTLLACLLPSLRAARIDPMEALRSE